MSSGRHHLRCFLGEEFANALRVSRLGCRSGFFDAEQGFFDAEQGWQTRDSVKLQKDGGDGFSGHADQNGRL